MGRVIHFEITAKDTANAASFYEKVFDWKFDKWEGPMEYWLVTTGNDDEPGINGGLGPRGEEPPGTINTIDVRDAQKTVALIEKAGGRIISPVHAIPGIGWNAFFVDPDGNQWGIIQQDTSAK
jgi:predicted enzyme related to lactoylglutathione lyase